MQEKSAQLATVPAELTATVGVKDSRVVEALTSSGARRPAVSTIRKCNPRRGLRGLGSDRPGGRRASAGLLSG